MEILVAMTLPAPAVATEAMLWEADMAAAPEEEILVETLAAPKDTKLVAMAEEAVVVP